MLTPKGHVEHDLHLVDDGETTWITTEPGQSAALVGWLDSMRFMLRVEVADVTADWAVLGEPSGAESQPGEPLAWRDPWPDLVGDTAAYGPVEGHPAHGRAWREVLVPRAELAEAVGDRDLAGTLGERGAAGRGLAPAARVRDRPPHHPPRGRLAAHRRAPAQGLLPRAGDGRAGAQPRPAAAPPGVPAPRRLRATPCPSAGAPVLAGDRQVGQLTSVARHYEDGPIGLALVKRNTPVDEVLDVAGVSASQTVVVAP